MVLQKIKTASAVLFTQLQGDIGDKSGQEHKYHARRDNPRACRDIKQNRSGYSEYETNYRNDRSIDNQPFKTARYFFHRHRGDYDEA